MKYFLLCLMTVIALPCRATVCGLYQVEDFGDRVLYTITRFATKRQVAGQQTVFTITNPASETVRNMVRGLCYCVNGVVQQDPEFIGDENYQLLTLMSLDGPPYTGCMPPDQGSGSGFGSTLIP